MGGAAAAAGRSPRSSSRSSTAECTFYTVLGDDELGRRSRERLTELGVTVRAEKTSRPTRRAFVYVDAVGERTITVLGEKLALAAVEARGGSPRPRRRATSSSGDAEALWPRGGPARSSR